MDSTTSFSIVLVRVFQLRKPPEFPGCSCGRHLGRVEGSCMEIVVMSVTIPNSCLRQWFPIGVIGVGETTWIMMQNYVVLMKSQFWSIKKRKLF
jgi:hypothetical protein